MGSKLFIFWLGGAFALILFQFLYNPTKPSTIYHHPEIKIASEIYQIPMSDSVSDVCFDGRFKKVVVIEGAMLLQQCEIDSHHWHFNIKTK